MPDASAVRSAAPQRLRATVRGRVQGVGFRHFTRRTAERLGLAGFVRNERDGTVTVVAEGERAALDRLLAALRSGPDHAAVDTVDASWDEASGGYSDFSIDYV